MTRAPPSLVGELEAAVHGEREAHAALVTARGRYRVAIARTTAAAGALRSAGLSMTSVASVIARAMNLSPSVQTRTKIAARFRKRTARHRGTPGHAGVIAPSTPRDGTPLPSGEVVHLERELEMPRLVKRIITEEQFVDEGAPAPKKKAEVRGTHSPEELDDAMDEFVDEEEDDEEQEQRRHARRRSTS